MHATLSGLFKLLFSVRFITGVCAAWGILVGTYDVVRAQLSRSWVKTRGRIVASLVDVTQDNQSRSEVALIAYQYTVRGLSYNRSSINGGMDSSWSSSMPGVSSALATLNRYPLDAEVDVYYWPMFPGMACLRPGKGQVVASVVLLGSLALLGAVLFVGRGKAAAEHPKIPAPAFRAEQAPAPNPRS